MGEVISGTGKVIQSGTPVPRANRETGRGSSAVISYVLPPDELERKRQEWERQKTQDDRFKLNKAKQPNGRVKTVELTREEYLVKRISGMNRAAIAREQGIKPPTLYHHLSKWGLRDPIVEEAAMEELKQRMSAVGTPASTEDKPADPSEPQSGQAVASSDGTSAPDPGSKNAPKKVSDEVGLTLSVDVPVDDSFIKRVLGSLVSQVHGIAVERGWYETPVPFPQAIALIHSELSEALEADRKHQGTERVAEELADVVIRVMDTAAAEQLDLAGALLNKIERNRLREHRHGGLKY